ncbi:UDP-2,3-diacylglucosamine diphosphatase [Syntrophotalea carbinolica]|nr:UDP-2,3-diacylglucosamine diphosphatase [Syntrophotalea carbinolica]
MDPMKDLFLADTHLLDPCDEPYLRLLDFLDGQCGSLRSLVMLGDIFEFWLGYRHTVFSAYLPLLERLRRLHEAGTELVFVEGNHDFHLGPYFSETLDCRILPDGGALERDGRKIFIAHGDLVNPKDTGYRVLRRVLRHPLSHRLMMLVPPDTAWRIARWASAKSSRKNGGRERHSLPHDDLLNYARQRFSEGYDTVITGHFHVPLLHHENGHTLIALGDWTKQPSYAVLEDGVFTLYPS